MIRLGTLAGYSFEGPRLLAGWTPPEDPGVYVIMYKEDPDNKADTYAVIYVGHTENFAEEGFPFKHRRAPCWVQRAGTRYKVHIATYYVPGVAASYYELIAHQLTALYDPYCNEQKYDRAWKDEWIGEYEAETTGPLAGRGPDESPL